MDKHKRIAAHVAIFIQNLSSPSHIHYTRIHVIKYYSVFSSSFVFQEWHKAHFHWEIFIQGSLLSIKIHHTDARPLTSKELPSIQYIARNEWITRGNNTAQFVSPRCAKSSEFQNTTSFLQDMRALKRALSLVGLFHLFEKINPFSFLFLPWSLSH